MCCYINIYDSVMEFEQIVWLVLNFSERCRPDKSLQRFFAKICNLRLLVQFKASLFSSISTVSACFHGLYSMDVS